MQFSFSTTRLESILAREWSLKRSRNRLVGVSSHLPLALALSQAESEELHRFPHLIIFPSETEAKLALSDFQALVGDSRVHFLPAYDVSPYSGLYPRPTLGAERLRFLFAAQSAQSGDIFLASAESLLQKTLAFDRLQRQTSRVKPGVELPEKIHEYLNSLGYEAAPMVEDLGQYAWRGGVLDIFSPAHTHPLRIELFGDEVASLRHFSPLTQNSTEEIAEGFLIPCREVLFDDQELESVLERFRSSWVGRPIEQGQAEESLRALSRKNRFEGMEFLLQLFDPKACSPVEHFSSSLSLWFIDPVEKMRILDRLEEDLQKDFAAAEKHLVRPPISDLYIDRVSIPWPPDSRWTELSRIDTEELSTHGDGLHRIPYSTSSVQDLVALLRPESPGSEAWTEKCQTLFLRWLSEGYEIHICCRSQIQLERLRILLDKIDSGPKKKAIALELTPLSHSLRDQEQKLILLRDEDLLGKKARVKTSSQDEFQSKAKRLHFGELKVGDTVVHTVHGLGHYDGLKVMDIGGSKSEFIQISYKDKDKLYLPVYRIGQLQKYSGHASVAVLDKLGGSGWEKTKTKVKSALKDLASELLELYAKRAQLTRPGLSLPKTELLKFENAFPFDETEDQLRSVQDIFSDLCSEKPMDRLVCGDVGFGKTEVAMRAAFLAYQNKKQVVVVCPTTVLCFQHDETFRKRFAGWPIEIRSLNRFVSPQESKKTLAELKAGTVNILIGTHRALSQDVVFQNLGLLIVDEEQKFGVAHKEKLKKMKTSVDTLTLSATPIPRTLNMSLMGVRDLSLINSAPVDRLPTRTFITKWDGDLIRKSIMSEISRGGQVYFIHNRVQSIYGLADELRSLVPEARLKVAHGQMPEDDLEQTMVQFFHHEIDILVCTAIVESGMDVSRANTMFIDQAQLMGLSQLYQLRGRVGRSKQRAYCYLILPRGKEIDKLAQERLKVIQENTALGSGIRIAQYDLELRGAGDFLGESQSGHINAVGYELYMDLLNEAIAGLRGESLEPDLEPEINLRIPTMIPDSYMADIRLRLSYYKALADIQSTDEIESIERELKDQFGPLPESTQNLLGVMLIRFLCKQLGIRDLSAGTKSISLQFAEQTKFKPERAIQLAMKENKKYSLTPDSRLNIRINSISWPQVYDELSLLLKMLDH